MAEASLSDLSPSVLREELLRAVASDSLDYVPDEFDDKARFVLAAVRAAARRAAVGLTAFVLSEAPQADVGHFGFSRVWHMQDGHGALEQAIIVTNRGGNNGFRREIATAVDPLQVVAELEELKLHDRCTVIWDAGLRIATVYPEGISDPDNHFRTLVPMASDDLTQDDVCAALDLAYSENLKNPSCRTVHLWSGGTLLPRAEDEIERHVKGQLSMYFAGRDRHVKVLSQVNTTAGRTDLVFLQRASTGGPQMTGVLELKVLRGPGGADYEATTEGLSQGYFYRDALELPFATLALYDVTTTPTDDVAPLLVGQQAGHLSVVKVRRYPLFDSPRSWRDAAAA